VGVYENGTYIYGGDPVCLSVVAVPTPRFDKNLMLRSPHHNAFHAISIVKS